jgi:hypothetical protein
MTMTDVGRTESLSSLSDPEHRTEISSGPVKGFDYTPTTKVLLLHTDTQAVRSAGFLGLVIVSARLFRRRSSTKR